jgi:hypothetical protein
VQVDPGGLLLHDAQPPPVVLERVFGMNPPLHADLGGAELDRLANALAELLLLDVVGVG